MYVILRNIEISEDWIVNFINKNLTSNFDRIAQNKIIKLT